MTEWLETDAREELQQVRLLLVESSEQLEQALRLPLSNECLKGIVTRQGPQVHVNAQYKQQRKEFMVQYQQSIPQLSIIMDALAKADRVLVLFKQSSADLKALLAGAEQVRRTLIIAQKALIAPTDGTIFPEKVRPLQPGVGSEVYIKDSELMCVVYTYQDTSSGRHQALSKMRVHLGDPGLLSFMAKLEAGIQRITHVCHKLATVSEV